MSFSSWLYDPPRMPEPSFVHSHDLVTFLSRQHTPNAPSGMNGSALPPRSSAGITFHRHAPENEGAAGTEQAQVRDAGFAGQRGRYIGHEFGAAEIFDASGQPVTRSTSTAKRPSNRDHDNWRQALNGLSESAGIYFQDTLEVDERLKDAEAAIFQKRIEEACADGNGTGRCSNCGLVGCAMNKTVQIHIITLYYCHQLAMPIFLCSRCQKVFPGQQDKSLFHADPAQFGAFPATPVVSRMAWKSASDKEVLYYDLRLLQQLTRLKDESYRLSIQAFVAAMFQSIMQHGCAVPITEATMRKQLSVVYQYFLLIDTMAANLNSHGVKGFDHVLSACAACMGSQDYLRAQALHLCRNSGASHAETICSAARQPAAAAVAGRFNGGDEAEPMDATGGAMNVAALLDAEFTSSTAAQEETTAEGFGVGGDGAANEDGSADAMAKAQFPSSMEADEDDIKLVHGLNLDANFRVIHQSSAGTTLENVQQVGFYMIPDATVEAALKDQRFSAKSSQDKDCADFTADKQSSKRSGRFDRTGVMACMCRHSFVLAMCNLFTGERWAYATLMLFTMIRAGICPLFMWYDINCRYKGHAVAWAAACSGSLLSVALAEWVSKVMGFPLPPWHHYMHNSQCQSRNSFRTMPHAGTGYGEPVEVLWSRIGALGHLVQFASLPARDTALERALFIWNERRRLGLPSLLGRMHYKAILKRKDAETRLELVEVALQKLFSDPSTVRDHAQVAALQAQIDEMKQNPPSFQGGSAAGEMHYLAELVNLSLVVGIIDSSDEAADGAVDLLLDDKNTSKLSRNSQLYKNSKRRLSELENQRNGGLPLPRDGAQWRLGWALLCAWRMREQQDLAISCQVQIHLIKYLFEKSQSMSTETKKLDKMRVRERAKLEAIADKLVRWCKKLQGAVFDLQSAGLPMLEDVSDALREAMATLRLVYDTPAANLTTKLKLESLKVAVMNAEYPWSVAGATSQAGKYRTFYHTALAELERAKEELELVRAECEGLPGQYRKEVDAIDAAIEEHEQTLFNWNMEHGSTGDAAVGAPPPAGEAVAMDFSALPLAEVEQDHIVGEEMLAEVRRRDKAAASLFFLQLKKLETEGLVSQAEALLSKIRNSSSVDWDAVVEAMNEPTGEGNDEEGEGVEEVEDDESIDNEEEMEVAV